MSKEGEGGVQPIRGDVLRKAFDQLDVLGLTVKEAIIEDIEKHGMVLDSNHHYTLSEIESRLRVVFGEDGSGLLVKRLKASVSALRSFAVVSAPLAGLFVLAAVCGL